MTRRRVPGAPRNPRKWQPTREDMKAAIRHIEKLAGMLCAGTGPFPPDVETDSGVALSVGKSETFVEIYKERMEMPA